MNVRWLRDGPSRIAHAFAEVDLSAGFERVEPVAPCGRYTLDQLQEDELAERCRACERVVQERQ